MKKLWWAISANGVFATYLQGPVLVLVFGPRAEGVERGSSFGSGTGGLLEGLAAGAGSCSASGSSNCCSQREMRFCCCEVAINAGCGRGCTPERFNQVAAAADRCAAAKSIPAADWFEFRSSSVDARSQPPFLGQSNFSQQSIASTHDKYMFLSSCDLQRVVGSRCRLGWTNERRFLGLLCPSASQALYVRLALSGWAEQQSRECSVCRA